MNAIFCFFCFFSIQGAELFYSSLGHCFHCLVSIRPLYIKETKYVLNSPFYFLYHVSDTFKMSKISGSGIKLVWKHTKIK